MWCSVKGSVALNRQKHIRRTLTEQLVPGNMASFGAGAASIAVTSVKTEEYVSWIKRLPAFRDRRRLKRIVKRVSRYYDAYK